VAAPFAGLREKRLQVSPEDGVEERLLRLPPVIAQRRAGGAVMALPGRRDRLAGRRHPCRLRKRRALPRTRPSPIVGHTIVGRSLRRAEPSADAERVEAGEGLAPARSDRAKRSNPIAEPRSIARPETAPARRSQDEVGRGAGSLPCATRADGRVRPTLAVRPEARARARAPLRPAIGCRPRLERRGRPRRKQARYGAIVEAARASAATDSGPTPRTTTVSADAVSATVSAGERTGSSPASGARMYM